MSVRTFRRRTFACQQMVELVTDYLEGALSHGDRRRFEAHLAGCPHCTEYLRQMRTVISLSGQLTPDDLSPEMETEFLRLFRTWRSESGPM